MSVEGQENPPKIKVDQQRQENLRRVCSLISPLLTDYSSKLNTTLSTTSNFPCSLKVTFQVNNVRSYQGGSSQRKAEHISSDLLESSHLQVFEILSFITKHFKIMQLCCALCLYTPAEWAWLYCLLHLIQIDFNLRRCWKIKILTANRAHS